MSAAARQNVTMGPIEWGLLVLLSVLWGGSFFFVEVALAEMLPLTLVFCRDAFAAAALILFLYAKGLALPTDLRLWGAFILMGAINNLVPFSLIFWGQTQISSSLASILNATTPLWTVVLAHLLTADEKMTRNRLAGVLLGLVGVVVMIGPEVLGGLGLYAWGQIAVVAPPSPASSAAASRASRRWSPPPGS